MNRRFRLTSSTDFRRVRRLGKSYAHPLIVLISLYNDDDQTRIGVAAGRSVGNAVQRNRVKRLLRAAVQPYLTRIVPGWNVILIARRPMIDADFGRVQESLIGLLRRAHLLELSNDN